ncbi:MAG: carboxypeptidase-like regulatory domain-containing protein [Bryobacteraceae bacterium]
MKKLLGVCLAFFLYLSPEASAQVNAVLGGTVSDPTGAVLPDVQVSATNVNTGIVTKRETNNTGNYEFPSLQPGTYSVTAASMGFQTGTFTGLQLGQGQQVRQNFTLQIQSAATSIEVVEEANTTLTTTTASVGAVLSERSVLTLPILNRNVLDLAATSPGVVTIRNAFGAEVPNFSGTGTGQVNTTRDGVITNDGRYNDSNGAYSAIFTSPDMVEEVRVSTNTVDAAQGRGVAQVQMRTRAGTNAYHGAVFYTNNNSALSSNDYFANLRGAQKSYTNRNQYGGRLGGAIVKNKAFFFVLIDNQRYVEKVLTTATVLTQSARNGVFRYLTEGAAGGTTRRNGNALSGTPSVDLNGNILTRNPTNGASLFTNQFNVFTDVKDPNRTRLDTGWFSQYMNRMPLPNDYSVGDGLNTAGYRWYRRQYGVDGATGQSANPNRDHLTTRFDYQINDSNKLSFTMTREKDFGVTAQAGLPDYPNGYFGEVVRKPDFYTIQWTKVISPSLLNEFRFGQKRDTWQGLDAFDKGCCFGASETNITAESKDARALFPTTPDGNLLYVASGGLGLGTFANFNVSTPRLTYSPLRQFADTLTWNHGAHSVQFGGELDRFYSRGINGGGQQTTRPFITLGVGSVPITGITTAAFAGLNSQDIGPAQNLLANLAGSIGTVQQQYFVNSPTAKDWTDYKTSILFTREHHQNDWNFFFKDSWKASKNLTLNFGVRYDKYGTPYDSLGLGGRFNGGQSGLFGISGTNFANAQWAPYANNGSLTTTEFVGKFSPQPNKLIFGNDWNNFAPSLGFAYNVPWLKKSTVLRGGYGINYAGAADFLSYSSNIANLPGFNFNVNTAPTGYQSLATTPAVLNQVTALAAASKPFTPVDVTGSRSTGIVGYADDRVTPYIQSFNLAIQHEIARNITLEVGWVGNKATKLYSNTQINESNIFENGILSAFNTTRAGGNAPLFNRMLNGVVLAGVGTVGQTLNTATGLPLTGSDALRRFQTTNVFIANGDVGGLANLLNTSNAFGSGNGGALRRSGLPENFIVANPQFGSVNLAGNNTNSTYHSVQATVTQRYSRGFSGQFSYVFSKSLGADAVRDPRNRILSKTLTGNNRPHIVKFTGTWDLPFGSKGYIAHNAKGVLEHIIGGWQLAPVIQWASGSPLSFTSAIGTVGSRVSNTADMVGTLNAGNVHRTPTGAVQYFVGYSSQTAPVPNYGADQATLAGRNTNLVVVDAAGKIVLQNPQPGFTGNTSTNLPGFMGPNQLGFDLSLAKKVSLGEARAFTFRADIIDALNKPIWGNPNTNINSTSFGLITTAAGNRTITLNARFDF